MCDWSPVSDASILGLGALGIQMRVMLVEPAGWDLCGWHLSNEELGRLQADASASHCKSLPFCGYICGT